MLSLGTVLPGRVPLAARQADLRLTSLVLSCAAQSKQTVSTWCMLYF